MMELGYICKYYNKPEDTRPDGYVLITRIEGDKCGGYWFNTSRAASDSAERGFCEFNNRWFSLETGLETNGSKAKIRIPTNKPALPAKTPTQDIWSL